MSPEERAGIEAVLAGGVCDEVTSAWLKLQLEHNDWDNSIARMGGGPKARAAYMNPIFDARCAVTAFDMHAQLTGDGGDRGLWIWLVDESKARAAAYDKWAADTLVVFCTLAGIADETQEKFRLAMAMAEFKRIANAKVHEAALLEWPAIKQLHAVLSKQVAKQCPKPKPKRKPSKRGTR